MCQCATVTGSGIGFRFWQDDVDLGVHFDGGQISSDGGLPWVVHAEAVLGVCAALAASVPEWRRGGVRHSVGLRRPERCGPPALGSDVQAGLRATARE
jgi:hypothetical protein